MSYEALETSAEDGRPVEIYTFTRGSIVWRFTSADRDLVVETNTYKAAVIRRGPIEQGTETMRSNLTMTVPHSFPVAALYKIASPSDPILVVVRQFHYGDNDIATLWQGEILGVTFSGKEAEIIGEPAGSSLRTTGLRRCWQRTCPYILFGPECTLSPETFRVLGVVSGIADKDLTVPAADALANKYFDGGYLEWEIATGVYERRSIMSHVDATVRLDVVPLGIAIGQQVRMYPGCDHLVSTCHLKFNNSINYGGQVMIPIKNPMGSDPIF